MGRLFLPIQPIHGTHGATRAFTLYTLKTTPRVRVVYLLSRDGVDEDARQVGVLPVAVLVGRHLARVKLLASPAPVAQGLREVNARHLHREPHGHPLAVGHEAELLLQVEEGVDYLVDGRDVVVLEDLRAHPQSPRDAVQVALLREAVPQLVAPERGLRQPRELRELALREAPPLAQVVNPIDITLS